MTILLEKILPLYIFMIIGYIAAKQLSLDKRSISALVIYFITPLIVFYGTAKISFSVDTLLLPLLSFLLFSISGIIARYMGKCTPALQSHQAIVGFMGWNGNTGYFGIPLILGLLWESYFSYAILVGLGALLFENTIGMYFLAQDQFSGKQALKKVASMPTIYGFLLGAITSYLGIHLSSSIDAMFQMYKSCYIVMGMMIIGIGLYREDKGHVSYPFLIYNLLHKFLLMPLVFRMILQSIVMIYPSFAAYQQVYMLISIVPLAAGSISLAIEFKQDVYNVALSVVVSTLIAIPIIYIYTKFLP